MIKQNKTSSPLNNYNLENIYSDFWQWFEANETRFFEILHSGEAIEEAFFGIIAHRLSEIVEGIFFLAGIHDKDKAELIFTPDGAVKNIVFVERLVEAAPQLKHWKFTALKPEHAIKDINIEVGEHVFDAENLKFYANEHALYPDEIDLVIVYEKFNNENKDAVYGGAFIFLDHYLGEINTVTQIDNINIAASAPAAVDLIPIGKLKEYLNWREMEFVERYSDTAFPIQDEGYATFEATLASGSRILAIVNSAALQWEHKVSHPWILKISIPYVTSRDDGFPEEEDYENMEAFENDLHQLLQAKDGYIDLVRETGDGLRDLYFACKEFRTVSVQVNQTIKQFENQLNIEYSIFKDKYWQTFERYVNAQL